MKKMRNLAAALVFVQFLLVIPGLAQSQEFYEFDLMWPQLEQPWYFSSPQAIATNLSGNVYVADTWNNRIQKFRPAIISVHIQANGSDGPITVTPSDSVSIEVSLNPGDKTGQKADWWIAVNTPFVWPWNWYAYVYPTGWAQGVHMCVQAPLFALSPREVLNMALPPGEYTFYFAVDDPDGAAAGPWWGLDSVTVRVQ